jgi:hypothetical protein
MIKILIIQIAKDRTVHFRSLRQRFRRRHKSKNKKKLKLNKQYNNEVILN